MKIAILGTGAYGIALALMFYKNECSITMWTKFKEEKEMLLKYRENKKTLPKVLIPEDILITNSLEEAINDKDLIVIAVPSAFVDDVSESLSGILKENQHICLASKGIERDSCLFVSEIMKKHIKTENYAVISGPSFAIDIANGDPIGLSLATNNKETKNIILKSLQNDTLKLRWTTDILGVEICGSIKNIIAIAAGILKGLGFSESTQAMFITESLNDIKELIKAFGGDKKTILSFAGFGDLLLTATSSKSRNFTFGYMIGSKIAKEQLDEYKKNTTIEGLYSLKSIYKLVKDKNVEIPIIDLIYDIIFKEKDPRSLASFLIEKE